MVLFYAVLLIIVTVLATIISVGAISIPILSVLSQTLFFVFIGLVIFALLVSSLRRRT